MNLSHDPHTSLEQLRELDSTHRWYSLDDKRVCAICERLFSGREVRVRSRGAGGMVLRCPTLDCPGGSEHWLEWRPPVDAVADRSEERFRAAAEFSFL